MEVGAIARIQRLIIVAFVAALAIPSTLFVFTNPRVQDAGILEGERRLAATFPDLGRIARDPVGVTKGLEAYFDDHFPLRPLLVRGNALVTVVALHSSSTGSVVFGGDKTLFVGDEMTYYTNTEAIDDIELSYWAQLLETRRAWLAARGIRYLTVFVPNKSTMYPEDVPASIIPAQPVSPVERLQAYLSLRTRVSYVDVRGALFAAKAQSHLYTYQDSHWNYYGAYVGYLSVLDRLRLWFPELVAATPRTFEIRPEPAGTGDLVALLDMRGLWSEDLPIPRYDDADPVESAASYVDIDSQLELPSVMENVPTATRHRRAVVFVDSFGRALKPFLARTFQRTVFDSVNGVGFNLHTIEREHPDLVIQELVERRLFFSAPAE